MAGNTSNLFWVDITFRSSKTVTSMVKNVSEAFKQGVKKAGGNVIYCYKVIGEKQITAVVEDRVEAGVNVVNSAYGDQVDITCAPLRTYESFAKSVLGLTEEQAPPSDHKLPDEGVFFWIKFTLGQKGLSQADFLEVWKKEATNVLMVKNKMKVNIDLFKECGVNVAHALLESPSHDALDELFYNLPVVKLNGENVHTSVKRIRRV